MRTHFIFTLFILLGIKCAAQEITGPDLVMPGSLATFEIEPKQEASWCLVPNDPADCWKTDSSSARLYFATPLEGKYTIIAAMVIDGKPVLLSKTFTNGNDDAKPSPTPGPPVSSLESWITTQTPLLVKGGNLAAENRLVSGCFSQIVKRIDAGNIKTAQNARSQLQITLTATLAQASPTAVTDWMPFISGLSRELEKELGNKIDDLDAVKMTLQTVSDALESMGFSKTETTTPRTRTLPQVDQTTMNDCPNCRTPGMIVRPSFRIMK